MERRPVNTAVVPLEHVLDNRVRRTEHVLVLPIVLLEVRGARRDVLFPEPRNVPDTDRLVERGRDLLLRRARGAGPHARPAAARHGRGRVGEHEHDLKQRTFCPSDTRGRTNEPRNERTNESMSKQMNERMHE